MDHAAAERFVRDTLGCSCPDEVFRDLRVQPGDGAADGVIHVGGRLLVLLLDGRATTFDERFARLLTAGRQRRDDQGYHRVRFVVVADDSVVGKSAEAAFQASSARDERTHLHLIPPASIPPGLINR